MAKKRNRRTTVERPRKRRRRRHSRIFNFKSLLIIFIVVFLAVWNYSVRTFPMFNIKTIEVKNNEVAIKNDIITRSGIFVGDNIMSFSKRKASNAIEEIPVVKKASIHRKYPATVVINITEEESFFILGIEDNYYEVERNGKIISQDKSLTRFDVPLVDGIPIENVKVKDNVFKMKEPKMETVRNVLEFLKEEDLLDDLSQYHVSKEGKNYLYFENGSMIKFVKYEGFNEHKDFVKYFLKDMNKKQKVELVEGVDPIYSKM